MYFSSNSFTSALLVILLFLVFSSTGCDVSASVDNPRKEDNRYFDLKGFIGSEITRLSNESNFTKAVYVNGEKEEKVIEKLDLENELKPFSDSDINKPSWSDKYEVDSLIDETGKLIKLNYKAKDEKLRTQFLSVSYQNEVVSEIVIKNQSMSSVAEVIQLLSYKPEKGFIIESTQDVTTIEKNHSKIQVTF